MNYKKKIFCTIIVSAVFVCGLCRCATPLPPNDSAAVPRDFAGVVHAADVKSAQQFKQLRDMGVRWVLATLYWNDVERKEGDWKYGNYDAFVKRNKDAGNKIVMVLAYDTPWLYSDNEGRKKVDPQNLDHFINYVETTVERYKDTVDAWEIWNEPNGLFWRGSRGDYFELHKRTAAAIRAVKKDAYILGGAFWRTPVSFINAMFKYGAFENVDAAAFHPYGINPDESMMLYDKFKAALLKNKFSGDIFITEVGYPTGGLYPNKMKEERAPEYVIKTISALAARGARAVIWYELQDSHNKGEARGSLNSEDYFGLLYKDFAPKDGARAYSLCANLLAGTTYKKSGIKTGALPKSLVSLYFENADGGVLIVWNDVNKIRPLKLEGLSAFTIHDINEKSEERLDGTAKLDAGRAPLVITWRTADIDGNEVFLLPY
ncbi:MAG: hypothetical protein LBC77_03435 [Spirochaetaceae bacterium]|jgi:hypothetical protein|nr:hypothetical protein [Spirochaetaceae bacterium]